MYSIESEQSVIGACLIDPALIDKVSEKLTPADFFKREHVEMFGAMQLASSEGVAVDVISLGEFVERSGSNYNLAYATEMYQNTPGPANCMFYASTVAEYSKRRSIQSVLDQCSRLVVSDKSLTTDDIMAQVASQIGSLQGETSEGAKMAKDVLKSLAKAWDRRMRSSGVDGLSTGIETLDNRFNGWKGGDLIVVAGRPSMGKSVLGAQIAFDNAVKNNKRGLIFSLEMTAEQLTERATANLSGVHLDVFRKASSEEFGRHGTSIQVAVQKIGNCPIVIDDTPALHINQICARARSQHRRQPLSIVVVDHIHLVQATAQSREREMASITGALKALAKELGCPVIAVTQLNRGVEQRTDKRPLMSDLRDSGSIEQDADIVILLYRDEYYNPDNCLNPGVIEIITGKFREGETGKDYCSAQLHMSKIGDLAGGYTPVEAPAKPSRGFRGN